MFFSAVRMLGVSWITNNVYLINAMFDQKLLANPTALASICFQLDWYGVSSRIANDRFFTGGYTVDLLRKQQVLADDSQGQLTRCLSAFDLTLLGVGAIIGAGIFVVTGVVAATQTGPAIVFSYILAGLACLFSALSYAELAAAIGGCGSAYGYAYVGFGEIIAWIIGWDLLLEYTISIAAVAVGWSSYFSDLLAASQVHLPLTLRLGFMGDSMVNVFALFIIVVAAIFLIAGVKSSTRLNNWIVGVKLSVILLFILVAAAHVSADNWVPFMPFGWVGVLKGASLIFFAYLGFDAVSTSAEEVVNPQRNLPIGIIGSLFVATLLYLVVSVLLTGMVPYHSLNVASPMSHAMMMIGYRLVAAVVGVGALMGLTTVLLVLFYAVSRIFFAMARDGLLPSYFSVLHETTKAPVRIILLCAVMVSFMAGLFSIGTLTELVNIGTLVAFAMVCAGVLVLRKTQPDLVRPFKTPGMPYVPLLGIVSCLILIASLSWVTIMRFIVWFVVGMIVYFSFSKKNSRLAESLP